MRPAKVWITLVNADRPGNASVPRNHVADSRVRDDGLVEGFAKPCFSKGDQIAYPPWVILCEPKQGHEDVLPLFRLRGADDFKSSRAKDKRSNL